jgi:hypothetical protein
MLVFALLATGLGIALTALSLFVRPVPDPGAPSEAPPEGSTPEGCTPEGAHPPSRAELRCWGLPLVAMGLLATTLGGLDRPVETTVIISLGAGLPLGLVAAWLIQRLGTPRS